MKKETKTETLIKSSWSLKECFNQLRDESGVVKLTIEQQDEICGLVGKKEKLPTIALKLNSSSIAEFGTSAPLAAIQCYRQAKIIEL